MKVAGGGTLTLCQSVPEDARNEAVIHRDRQNRLRVVRQLRSAPDRDWSIDLAFFINGNTEFAELGDSGQAIGRNGLPEVSR